MQAKAKEDDAGIGHAWGMAYSDNPKKGSSYFICKQEQGNTVPYYIYADHINTPRVITRASDNAIVWRWDHADPFGAAAPDESPAELEQYRYNLRFPGQMFDAESGLHQNYFRDYDPRAGRYLQSDPIGLQSGINTYAYVLGNPVSYTDPTGEIVFVPIVVGIGAGLLLDYALSEFKKKHCTCKDAGTPAGPVGNAGIGAADGFFGAHDVKPRGGIAGGGPAGRTTFIFSGLNHAAAKRGAYTIATRNVLTSVARKIPYVGLALTGYEVYDAVSCD